MNSINQARVPKVKGDSPFKSSENDGGSNVITEIPPARDIPLPRRQRDESRKPEYHGQRIKRHNSDDWCGAGEFQWSDDQIDGYQHCPHGAEDKKIDFGDAVIEKSVVPIVCDCAKKVSERSGRELGRFTHHSR